MFKYLQIWKLLDLGLPPRQELWKASETQNEEEWRNKSSHPELLFFPFFFFFFLQAIQHGLKHQIFDPGFGTFLNYVSTLTIFCMSAILNIIQ